MPCSSVYFISIVYDIFSDFSSVEVVVGSFRLQSPEGGVIKKILGVAAGYKLIHLFIVQPPCFVYGCLSLCISRYLAIFLNIQYSKIIRII